MARNGTVIKGTGRILLVDDEEMVRNLHRELLVELGYQVTPCENAREAIDQLQQSEGQIDLVLSDLTMPEMTGLDMAHHIHHSYPDIPIILVTGYDDRINGRREA